MRRTVPAPILVLTTVAALLAGNAFAQPAPRAKPPFPSIQLPEARSQGRRAVELLGARLPEVAAWYGRTPDQLRSLLLTDRRLKLDRNARLYVEEELDQPLAASDVPVDVIPGALRPVGETFLLQSKPGAKRTVYLNFRGATLTGTAWNSGGNTIVAAPFDLDGVPGTFSDAELQRIQYIWQRVAEDYAPFDVNVTTQQPAPEALTRAGSADDVFGTTVLVTNSTGVYNCSCGGVAYVGAFDDTSDTYKPALVFYNQLGAGNEKYVAEAISHEAGHNGGLLHDGNSTTAYYQGHGSGITGWAPIMGVGYYQSLVQWSKGEYTAANNVQDDYAVMASYGLPIRADDHGSTPGTATALTAQDSGGVRSLAGGGVVERPGDTDLFSFSAGAGASSFSAAVATRSPNLDLRLELRDAAGSVLASANPTEELVASLSYTLPASGTYHLAVTGVGKGDPKGTGYSSYGSTGFYAVAGSVPTSGGGGGLPPVAVIGATPVSGTAPLVVNFSAAGSSDPDGSIASYAWTFGDGGSASGATASRTYATAGSYTAELRVTDNTGLSATASTVITVDAAVPQMGVADIGMSLNVLRNGRAIATAAVTVRDGQGQLVPGAVVSGSWSGAVRGNASATTGSNGVASIASRASNQTGSFTFTVTGIALPGYLYDPALNDETSDSISR